MIEEKQFFILYIMLKNILNLEGVAQLSKEEQKNVNGGMRLVNASCTGNTMTVGESTTVYECHYDGQRTFLGFNWGSPVELDPSNAYGPCPAGMMC